MKKTLWLFMLVVSLITLVACENTQQQGSGITISVNQSSVSLEEGETKQLVIETNDELGFTIESLDTSIAAVESVGIITAIKEGQTTVKIQSKTDKNVVKEVAVTVTKNITIILNEVTDTLFEGDTYQLIYTSTDDVTFSSSNTSVATVSNTGLLTLVAKGTSEITVQSVKNSTIKKTITITVLEAVNSATFELESIANAGTERQMLFAGVSNSLDKIFLFESSDETIATVDSNGKVRYFKAGSVDLTAKLINDESVSSVKTIEIRNEMIVDASKKAGDSIEVNGLVFVFGERLFADLGEALNHTVEGTKVTVMAGEYIEAGTISDDAVELIGETGTIIKSRLTLTANNVKVTNIEFTHNGSIEATTEITGVSILNNKFENLAAEVNAIKLEKATNILIQSNTFNNVLAHAILLLESSAGNIEINKNKITGADIAIVIASDALNNQSNVTITRNEIANINTGFDIAIPNKLKLNYARFNAVENYKDLAAKSLENNEFDFTLNFWGQAELNDAKFLNIQERFLVGNYESKSEITAENKVIAGQPLKIMLTNLIEEVKVRESYRLTWEFLPYETTGTVRFITSNSNILMVANNGTLDPKQSGLATITARLSNNTSINTPVQISVTTDPGIELTPSKKEAGIVVGESFKLEAKPFPYTIKDEQVIFESSNESVATVDALGNITSLSAGTVKITAKLATDHHIISEYNVEFFTSLDQNNLLDLLTMNQVSYTQAYTYTANGVGFAYTTTQYESVSKYYFGDYEVNTEKIVPISTGIRPGSKRNPIPEGLPRYNDDHVYWVVIHDTANTDPSSSALSHANYLWNAVKNGTILNTSWHYTIDDVEIYQHLPEDEVGYHAGDGSNLPGQGSYTGGGNRNGIGIETSVAQNDDLYRVWQITAKFAADALVRWNLPRTHIKYHRDFSGKICPNVLINSGLMPYFEQFADIEYKIAKEHANAQIMFESNNPDLLDNTGRIIKMPDYATQVSYTITVVENGITQSRTFQVLLPGTIR